MGRCVTITPEDSMALIKCTECSHTISDKAAACPQCGAPNTAAAEAGSTSAGESLSHDGLTFSSPEALQAYKDSRGAKPTSAATPGKKDKPKTPWWAWAIAIPIGVYVGVSCAGRSDVPSSSASLSSIEALTMCQSAIKRLSRDPDNAEVPYVTADYDWDQKARFVWGPGTRYARLRNGLGLEVPTTADCTVQKYERTISSLSINGEPMISK